MAWPLPGPGAGLAGAGRGDVRGMAGCFCCYNYFRGWCYWLGGVGAGGQGQAVGHYLAGVNLQLPNSVPSLATAHFNKGTAAVA